MAQVTIAREHGDSGGWLAEGDIGECAYFANASTLTELKVMIREAADLADADPEIATMSETLTDTVTGGEARRESIDFMSRRGASD